MSPQEKPSDEHQPPVSAPSEDQKPTDHPDGVADDQQTLGREDTTVTSVVETPGPEEEGEKREKHVTIQVGYPSVDEKTSINFTFSFLLVFKVKYFILRRKNVTV